VKIPAFTAAVVFQFTATDKPLDDQEAT